MKKQLKKQKENFDKPTPLNWRRFGDGLLLISGLATLFVPGLKWAIAVGMIGKYLSDFKS